jgi:hypothetical protein
MPTVLVETIEGRLGGGKTLFAMERIARRIAEGGTVGTNIMVRRDGLRQFILDEYGVHMEDDQLIIVEDKDVPKIWEKVPPGSTDLNTLLVVDEAHTIWRRGATKRGDESPVILFITLARKTFTDCIFIAPSLSSVDSQLADYNHYCWRLRNMQLLSLFGIQYPFPQVNRCRWDGAGDFLIDNELVTRDKRLFKTYDTYHIVKAVDRPGAVGKRELKKRKNEKNMKLLVIVVLLIAGLAFGVQHWRERIETGKQEKVAAGGEQPARKVDVSTLSRMASGPSSVLPAVRIEQERFRNSTEGVSLATETTEYTVGELCPRGMVVSVRGRIVQVKRLDGGTDYVVPLPGVSAPASFQVAPVAVQLPPAPLLAPAPPAVPTPPPDVEQKKPSLSQTEGRRITGNLRRSLAERSSLPSP